MPDLRHALRMVSNLNDLSRACHVRANDMPRADVRTERLQVPRRCIVPPLLQRTERADVTRLQAMGSVGRKTEKIDAILHRVRDHLVRKMTAVTVEHEDDGLIRVGVGACLRDKLVLEPVGADVIVSPSCWRRRDTLLP